MTRLSENAGLPLVGAREGRTSGTSQLITDSRLVVGDGLG